MKRLITSILSLFMLTCFAQGNYNGSINGKVVDKATFHPISGATVYIMELETGVATDSTGSFSLSSVRAGAYTVRISYIGYHDKLIHDVVVSPGKTFYVEVSIEEDIFLLADVEVKSFRYENDPQTPVSSFSFSREEIFRNPGAAGDIFRAIGMLPGVQSSGGEFSAIAVRGQGTTDNVYMVDDIPLSEVGHLEGSDNGFNDPQGGRFSIFSPRVIQNANFQAGGFSAQYGRKSSAYLGLEIKEGNRKAYGADAQFDLLGFTLNAEGPVGKNTGIFISSRYQNFKSVLKMIGQEKEGYPAYADFLIKTTTDIGKKNKLSLLIMYNPEIFARNVAHILKDEKLQDDFLADVRQDKGLVGINLKTLTGSSSFLKSIVYYRFKSSDYKYGRAFIDFEPDGSLPPESKVGFEKEILYQQQDEKDFGARFIFNREFKNDSRLMIGLDAASLELDYERRLNRQDTSYVFVQLDARPNPNNQYRIILPQFINGKYKETTFNNSLYGEYSFLLFKRLHFNIGERYDHTGFTKDKTISHRISGTYQATEKSSFNFSTGLFYNDPILPDIADQEKTLRLKSEKTTQVIAGYKTYFSSDLKFTLEGYYKKFDHLVVRPDQGSKELTNRGTGIAYGIDMSLIKRLSKKYYGQVSYSYMESKRDDGDGRVNYDFLFSQPHIINLLASYKPNNKWIYSGKFRYATGRPTSSYIIHTDVFNDPSFKRFSQEVVKKNDQRLNDFISLDIRVDYRTQFQKWALMAFLDVANFLDRKNANYNEFFERTGAVSPAGLGILPTLGVRLEL